MHKTFLVFTVPALLVLAGCGGSSGSSEPPFASTDEVCNAYSEAMAGFPSTAPELTSAGLNAWASQVRIVAEETADIASRTDDALLSQLIRDASDGLFRSVEATEAAAQDPSDEAIAETNEALVDGTQSIRDVTTACSSRS